MNGLKILAGVFAVFLAWVYLYQSHLMIKVNKWVRETLLNDELVLFSNRRMAILLFVLGGVGLFSGLSGFHAETMSPKEINDRKLARALVEFQSGQFDSAIAKGLDLVHANPNNVDAWELLAMCWWLTGEHDQARNAALMLIAINPKYPIQKTPFYELLQKKSRVPSSKNVQKK